MFQFFLVSFHFTMLERSDTFISMLERVILMFRGHFLLFYENIVEKKGIIM